MSEPVLTATLALAIAVIFTAAIAIVTLAAETLSRAVKLIGVVAVSAFAVVALQQANLRMNFTGSMPIGIYALSRLPPGGVKRGMFVVACAPIRAAKIGQRRGYLAAGPCADNTELLLKTVAATPSDEVDVTSAGAAVNGCLLPQSRPLSLDAAGRRLLSLTQGNYRLRPAQVWLYAPNDRSWDSRYWGPASTADVRARAVPLLTARLPSFLRVAGRAWWRSPLERFMESLRSWGLNSHVSNHGTPPLSSRLRQSCGAARAFWNLGFSSRATNLRRKAVRRRLLHSDEGANRETRGKGRVRAKQSIAITVNVEPLIDYS